MRQCVYQVKQLKSTKEWAASSAISFRERFTSLLGCTCSEVAVICFSMAFALNIGLNNFSLSLVAISRAAQHTLHSHSGMECEDGIGPVQMKSTCLSSAACPQDQYDHPYLFAALHSHGLARDGAYLAASLSTRGSL